MPRAQGGGETGKPVEKLVWAMKRSEIRGSGARTFPDYAALHPGYISLISGILDD